MKYIIDISDEAIDFMGGRDHFSMFVEPECKVGDCKHYALRISKGDIEPYTEPNRKAVDLQYARDIENVAKMNYNEGAKDAWEFVKNIGSFNGLAKRDLDECFGHTTIQEVLTTYDTYREAKAKYEAWRKQNDEIRVGDEIKVKGSSCADAVVIGMDDDDLYIVWKDGEMDRIEPPQRKEWVKTGRHFNEVTELLKKITGESNED